MQRARGVGSSRHEMRAEDVAVHMGTERTGPSNGRRWWRWRVVRFRELDGPANLAGKVRLDLETVEVSSPRVVGRVGGLTESETATKIRQLRDGVQEVMRAERRSSASEPKLKFHVASRESSAIAAHPISVPLRRPESGPRECDCASTPELTQLLPAHTPLESTRPGSRPCQPTTEDDQLDFR